MPKWWVTLSGPTTGGTPLKGKESTREKTAGLLSRINDVGTKRGEDYVYRFATLLNAIHDWTGVKEEIRSGARRVLIVE
ncbi:MAG TPA: hypothetical protein DEB30_02560 [Candidatus Peribacter riflensis]|uniref:Uncharacterized protein n=1 Tax=Candidatus Peribacter riflensis TaxID=1735162 RepID=A0A0S1SVA6_9BACT|nr:MAG: hypothetical protein PeribacterA2_0526 [Candidatus Peribacter riflensis]OGJ77060.1 MAG: hypothetical protein A2398_02945 [Candidatus Peribacteria bacterium RIFOXYB1_FULL_57_12]OGJ82635.1 MAG: hypothetical protein A2412_03435 [Candidatus Peribacteria bacterium RIFOXYC1_FULL_58_8]ALM11007.1 MAG: hypothetical protein PeribacterB2_0525 [Candidatus Peribacter riflensis]ALM12110.1 MAG: hypothetical protein PeribacterC2_0525 [Candidatus Peribacter riflensis]